MNQLAIKCYLPGRRTQYLLHAANEMSIDLGAGADLCPHDFDPAVCMQFRAVDGQWFVVPQLGELRREDGTKIEGPSALSSPMMLIAGSTTVVLADEVDPRIPTRVVEGVADSARQLAVAPPQPRSATPQPRVAPVDRAPTLPPLREPSVIVLQAERPARRELNETRAMNMAQFGVGSPAPDPSDTDKPTVVSSLIARVRENRRMLAYAVLGLGLVAFQFVRSSRAAGNPAAAHPAPALASASQSAQAPITAHDLNELEPPPAEAPSERRAAELFALGDFRNALRQYRALAGLPDAPPVFGVIAHSLEQRLSHPQVKR